MDSALIMFGFVFMGCLTVLMFRNINDLYKSQKDIDNKMIMLSKGLIATNETCLALCKQLIKDERNIAEQFENIHKIHVLIDDALNTHALYIERYHHSFLEYYYSNLHLKYRVDGQAEVWAPVKTPEQEFSLHSKISMLDNALALKGCLLPDDSSSDTDDAKPIS